MKFIHLSDLHLGKRVNEFSMLEEQGAILDQILHVIDREQPDGVLIAGDIYDKPIPSAEAVQLFDTFLVELSKRGLQVFVISGNHDSPERIAFGARIMSIGGIHLSPVYNGKVEPLTMTDAHGKVNIYLLPFVKPAHVRRALENEEIVTYTDAVSAAIEAMRINTEERNILVTHQFVTGGARSESEEISVGGSDNVDTLVFRDFDYVALGHLHGPQYCGSERIRYCGTPLKYSFSEANDDKSMTVVELKKKGAPLSIRTLPLTPLHEMRELRGDFASLTLPSFYEGTSYQTDYLHITLTDENDIPDAIARLRVIYQNLMRLDYDNARTRENQMLTGDADAERKSPLQLFAEFYEQQNNAPMSEIQRAHLQDLIETLKEELQ